MSRLPLDNLKNDLTFVIQNQIKNMRLIAYINEEFTSKGLEIEIPTMLFNGEAVIDVLENIEVLALSKACYKFLKESDIVLKGININPDEYFESGFITDYELYTAPQEKKNPVVIFDECRKIDAKNYWVYLTAEQHLNLRKNGNVKYFKGIQRMEKIVTLPSGLKIKKINTNPKGIKSMIEKLKKHKLKPTSIAFALLTYEDKKPKVTFKSEYKNTGTLRIETNFDRKSDNYAPLIIPDGYHRWTSYCDAYAEDDKIKEGLGVHIYFMSEAEAKQYVSDVFERNETDEEYKESLNDTSGSGTFINTIIENSDILRNNVSNTITEWKEIKNSLTYLGVLKECAKYTNINFQDEVTMEREAIKIGKIIDIMLNYIISNHFENEIKNAIDTFILAPNTFVGYIAIANLLKDNKDYKFLVGDIADKLISIKENLIHTLKLDVKNCDVEKIYNYFENVAKEVL